MAGKAAPKASKTNKKAKKSASSRTRGRARTATPQTKKSVKKVRAKTTKKKVKKTTKRTTRKPKAASSRTAGKTVRAKAARGSVTARRANKASTSGPTTSARQPSGATRRSERPLAPQEVEQFRIMLLEKRAEILGDVSTLHNEALNKDRRDATADVSSMPIHMADLGTDNYELEFTLGLIEGERAILQEIDEALERVQQGTYGLCLATGKPIGKARLKAKPWAKYCYEYTLAQEKNQGRGF